MKPIKEAGANGTMALSEGAVAGGMKIDGIASAEAM